MIPAKKNYLETSNGYVQQFHVLPNDT